MAKFDPTRSEQPQEPSAFLLHQWIAAGIVSAASRFIPVPFVEDWIGGQCRRFVVWRTLSAHRASMSLDELKPYYAGGGWFSGCAALVVRVPLKLLLFPIRKVVAVLTSIRGVPLEILQLVLLGRTLDRYLQLGKLAGDPRTNAALAGRMQVAFDEAFARMDFRLIRAAMIDALSGVAGWKAAAITSAKKLSQSRQAMQQELETEPAIDTGADRVQEVLARPETLQLFAEFDRRFDEAFARRR